MVPPLKTQANDASVDAFLSQQPPERRADCDALVAMMQAATGEPARMWGASIVGFARYRYRGASGRSGEWPIVGFSPRKGDLSIYLMPGLDGREALLQRLGKHRTGKSCLYLKRLADIDRDVLAQLVAASVATMEPQRVRD